MANLGRQKLNLKNRPKRGDTPDVQRQAKSDDEQKPTKNIQKIDIDDDDEDDEVIQESVSKKQTGSNKMLFIICGVLVILVVFIGFILLKGMFVDESPQSNQDEPQSTQAPQNQPNTQNDDANTDDLKDPGVGTQDFTGNTTMQSTSPMSNPDDFVKDLYGLTTRVDYNVSQIQSAADFVNYTKYRGTWGGGLELYYLDCTYKNAHYVVQIPFRFYKELDDTGIVPVKMEVLRIADSSSTTGYLTIISYMCLDEETLNTILKSQNK